MSGTRERLYEITQRADNAPEVSAMASALQSILDRHFEVQHAVAAGSHIETQFRSTCSYCSSRHYAGAEGVSWPCPEYRSVADALSVLA